MSWQRAVKIIPAVIFLALAMCAVGKIALGPEFWDQNGRFEIWSMGYNWYKEHAYSALGFGYSSSQILLPLEQVVTKHFHGDYFLWFHNDWLQLLVEGGWIGMLCIAIALGRLLSITWKRTTLFASVMGFLTLALFNYPLRMPIHAFCFTLVCGLAEAFAIRPVRTYGQTLKPSPEIRDSQPA